MAVFIYKKKRSVQSIVVEKILLFRGTKKTYSTTENTEKLIRLRRSENIKPYAIEKVTFSSDIKEEMFEDMQVFTLNDRHSAKQKVVFYLHGGAWVKQPLTYHWMFMDKLARTLDVKIIAPLYPKGPNFTHKQTYPKVLNLYKHTLGSVENPDQITIMGDSAGGTIALALAQLLKKELLPQPKELILLSACVDMTFSNPRIPKYEKRDPMLARAGMHVITEGWADGVNLEDPLLSPINGDMSGLAKISHFIGTHESLYPDAILFDEKLAQCKIQIDTFVYPKMNHVFVVMPVPEAQHAQEKIIEILS